MGSVASTNRQNENFTIMEWNIRHGGSMGRLSGIIDAIRNRDPDILILTEFRCNRCEEPLRRALMEMGYSSLHTSDVPERTNGILVASKVAMEVEDDPVAMHRLLPIRIPSLDMTMLALHIPGINDKWGKAAIWDRVLDYAQRHRKQKTLLIGDFNTGLADDAEGSPFALPEKMRKLLSIGYVDAWRSVHGDKREYTWWSTAGNGFRLDYAFLSPSLSTELVSAEHSQEERLSGSSDHASIVVNIRSA